MKGEKQSLEKVLQKSKKRIKIEKLKQEIYQPEPGLLAYVIEGNRIMRGYIALRSHSEDKGVVTLERIGGHWYYGNYLKSSKEADYVKKGNKWKRVSKKGRDFDRSFGKKSQEAYIFEALLETSKGVFGK
jgi:hypothetical protein